MLFMKLPDPYLARDLGDFLTAMPDNDPSSSSSRDAAPYEPRFLPVPVPPPREGGESWVMRVFRALFGRKPNSRADLKDVLDAMPPGESGFSPEESRMLKNILGLRERRVGDVMIPRADIVAVQQDIKLGELVRTFEGAAHSRLVVYNDTLDDPIGMVHIRDLIGFMTARAAVDPEKNAKRKKPLPAGLISRRSIFPCRCRRPRSCAKSCSCRHRRG